MESTNDACPVPQPANAHKQDRLSLWLQFPRRLIFLLIAGGLYASWVSLLRRSILNSARSNLQMSDEILERMPNSMRLLGFAFGLALLLSLVTMVIAYFIMRLETKSAFWGSLLRSLGRLWIFGDISLPPCALGLFLMWIFAMQLHLLPLAGMISPTDGNPADRLQHLILPVLTLVVLPAGLAAQAAARRMFISGQQGFRRWAGGILRLLSALFRQIGGILAALILVENIFAWPGIGRMVIDALLRYMSPVFLNVLYIFAGIILLGRLLSELFDWLGRIADPDTAAQPDASSGLKKGRKGWLIFTLILLVILLAFVVYGAITGLTTTNQDDLGQRMADPSPEHWLGTDTLGRDIWSRIAQGTSVTFGVAAIAAILVTLIAFSFGLLSGWLLRKRKWWSDLLADLVLLPADASLFMPIVLVGVVFLMWSSLLGFGGDKTWFTITLVTLLAILPRSTRFMAQAWQDAPDGKIFRSAGLLALALLLGNLFIAFASVTALDVLGAGIPLRTASLGNVLGTMRLYLVTNGTGSIVAILVLWFSLWSLYLASNALLDDWRSKGGFSWLNS